mmetsp:Transcript_14192/g.42859  ORF Transcript_14192/g.42859 Transcript_14192/m.42859 type:complete len:266 (-) Transcript_14192:1319-2116(-)
MVLREHDLEVTLAPPGPLLETVTNLVGCLTHCQVVLDIPTLPVAHLQFHPQSVILSQGVLWRPPALLERLAANQKVGSCAGDEAQGVVARLHVLPEVDVGVVEDVAALVEVPEALGTEHHAHVIAAVQHGDHAHEEGGVCHLVSIHNTDDLIEGDLTAVRVDLPTDVVQVARLSVHFALHAGAASDVHAVATQPLARPPLLPVLPVITHIDCPLATWWQHGSADSNHCLLHDVGILLVAGDEHAHMVLAALGLCHVHHVIRPTLD